MDFLLLHRLLQRLVDIPLHGAGDQIEEQKHRSHGHDCKNQDHQQGLIPGKSPDAPVQDLIPDSWGPEPFPQLPAATLQRIQQLHHRNIL